MRRSLNNSAVIVIAIALSACSQAQPDRSASSSVSAAATPATADTSDTSTQPTQASARRSLPPVTVHKSPSCGCCTLWVTHLEQAGFPVTVVEADDLLPIKQSIGVPSGMGSCHTAQVDGYFIEGHVPAEDIIRLLAERPDARGLALPGMPLGSPGMEVASGQVQPYVVHLVKRDGSQTEFSHHGH